MHLAQGFAATPPHKRTTDVDLAGRPLRLPPVLRMPGAAVQSPASLAPLYTMFHTSLQAPAILRPRQRATLGQGRERGVRVSGGQPCKARRHPSGFINRQSAAVPAHPRLLEQCRGSDHLQGLRRVWPSGR
jgi:hypothetical protein